MLIFGKEDLKLKEAKEKEWIITNGVGGYSSSTIIGLNTRKYHGLLIASLKKPLDRHLLLSKFEEEIIIDKKLFNLSINKYSNEYYPNGNKYLEGFVFNIYPTFNYKVENIDIIKSICMVHDSNAIIVSYKISSDKDFKINIKPFVNCRSFHNITHEPEWVFNQVATQRTTVIRPSYENSPAIIIGCDKGKYTQKGVWIYNMEYEQEKLRGYDCQENHFCPGEFKIEIKKGRTSINFLVVGDQIDQAYSTFDNFYSLDEKEYSKFFEYETNRIKSLKKLCYNFDGIKEDKLLPYLIQAADSFIVKNTDFGEKSIIAGYHWLDYSIRDAMISLPGLCLTTGRINDAKEILLKYANMSKNGLIPNKIRENGKVEYNSVDTSLWFVYSVYKFYKYTNNLEFIRLYLWNRIKDIINNYKLNVEFGFRMKQDGLICNESDQPLTWMNTKYTLRKGKCVEVNALWYNALKITELFAKRFKEDFEEYLVISNMVKLSFNKEFWNHEENCLYDVVDNDFKDQSIRPNQIIAISLPFRILNIKKEYLVVKKVTEELLTRYGLRTLSTKDKNYIGIYQGNEIQRDKSYHNGTVFGWLLGPYITSYLKIHNYSKKGKEEADEKIIKYIIYSLKDYGIGTISEIYNGDYPNNSKGNISSACGVAETIRSYIEDLLNKQKYYIQ
ncbi:glycogen debranching enzyme N-terminal domain-containing protein [Candidatus Woesearchaeota archaeon]|nr:glycogen debranching enzyme N-terminal domain-containing protein [Candidatus Woesearchaeota archaeon]